MRISPRIVGAAVITAALALPTLAAPAGAATLDRMKHCHIVTMECPYPPPTR